MCNSLKKIVGVLLLLIVAGNALAHRMKVFAWSESDQIQGQAYYAGAGAAKNSEIELYLNQQPFAKTQANAAGDFVFKKLQAGEYQVRANAGQGHISTIDVQIGPIASDTSIENPSSIDINRTADSSRSVVVHSGVTAQQVQKIITKAVLPLRKQLDQYEAKTRLHDILGGIGYLFGFFGLWMALRAGKKPTGKCCSNKHQASDQ
ncbi:hypothetical protein [Pelagibaculum spongiae]|uniref:Carboxypeptidase regulatory-like domain-containing protein n=1 Tax=Pelagibaculum spongiae TaxID=2080658 RepID=A0A2V1H2R8_9GAMM|nr:hypothetical protein [Pelagibaculum spongiae]PVZ72270.1 hypothetical protein DC094_04450 [Pelagibaculum spongiae]